MQEPSAKLRVMVDANVLLAGNLWPRWPYEVLQHGIQGDFQLVLTPLVIEQVRRTIAARFALETGRFEVFLGQLDFDEAPDPSPAEVAKHQALVRDATDVPIALAAIQARVDYLVSEDKDLTSTDATTAMLRERLKVLLCGTFLREVMGWTSEELEQVRGRTWHDLEPDE
jgi:predicted nucleic acid-binding protein